MVTGQADTGQGLHLSNGHSASPGPDLLNSGGAQGQPLGMAEERDLDHTPHDVTDVRGHVHENVADRGPGVVHDTGRDQQGGPGGLDQGLLSY